MEDKRVCVLHMQGRELLKDDGEKRIRNDLGPS